MRLVAIRTVRDRAQASAARFPFVVADAALATALAIILVDSGSDRDLHHGLQAALLGLPLLTALTLLGERLGGDPKLRWGLPLGGVAILVGFYSLARSSTDPLAWTRFFHWSLTFHLAVAVLPFATVKRSRGFWQFNRLLFERFLLAALYSLVLFLGLALALGAVDRLLGIDVDGDTYPRLFAILSLSFNTWFFLGGVPSDLDELDRRDDYPVGLKIFAQYILVPLVTVYLLILILYLGRVLITRTWPSGWIGYLVSGVSVVGTLALLLVHPVRDRPEERWVNGYARWFFIGLVPALVMALLAVGKRIGQYGITERRYALLVLALWLLALAIFYAVTRSRSIRLIPASLGLVSLLASFGPWGMIGASRGSQQSRFREIVGRHLAGGDSFRVADSTLGPGDRRELVEILSYLERVHGPEPVARLVNVPVDSARRWTAAGMGLDRALDRLGVGKERPGDPRLTRFGSFNLVLGTGDSTASAGILLRDGTRLYPEQLLLNPFRISYGPDTLVFTPRKAAGEVAVLHRDSVLAVFRLGPALDTVLWWSSDPRSADRRRALPVVLEESTGRFRIRLLITSAHWADQSSDSLSRAVTGTVLVEAR